MHSEWDEASKAGSNYRKHGVRMPKLMPVFEAPYAITIMDDESDSDEQRFVTLGMGEIGGLLDGRVHVARRHSGIRSCLLIGGKSIEIVRSGRPVRVTMSGMPLSTTGRCASNNTSSSFVYKSRVPIPIPPPVYNLQIASESHSGILVTLSNASTHERLAAISRSCSPFGTARIGAVWGRTKKDRNPETGRKVSRPTPESVWRRVEVPD